MIPRIPKFRIHPNGQAFVEHRSIPGKSHRLYLGLADSPEALKKYGEVIAQIAAGGWTPPIDHGASKYDAAIDELCLLYLDHAERYYSPKEFAHIVRALKALSNLYGSSTACKFGPRALTTLRESMIGRGWARNYINSQVARVKRLFRWACANERLPAELHYNLTCVRGLQAGRSTARETEPVGPVSQATVKAVLPNLPPMVRGMVQVQYLCGMRPEEVTIMRGQDLEMLGPVWLYKPSKHKNQWRGKKLVKAVPVTAQAILRPLLTADLSAYLFDPRKAVREKTGKPPADWIRDHYDTHTYGRAITRACEVTFGMPRELRRPKTAAHKQLASEWRAAHCWTPNQLRHSIATEISQAIGQQAAQRWLGHASLQTTGIYAEKETAELIAIAQELDRRWAG